MTTLREAAQTALESLEKPSNATLWHQAITALRAALAQQEQAPVDDGRGYTAIAFEAWWLRHGQFCRAGGGDYEKTFAWRAWEAALAIPSADAPQLAQQEQKPVAYRYLYSDGFWRFSNGERVNGGAPVKAEPLYTTPPAARVPLTITQVQTLLTQHFDDDRLCGDDMTLVRAIERAHGIGGEA